MSARIGSYSILRFTFLCCCALGSSILKPRTAGAQKVASYDFTNAKPQERQRPPLPPPAMPAPPKGKLPLHYPGPGGIVPGVCGGIAQPSLAVSVVSLDRDIYASGDEFAFVLKVEAFYPTTIPIRVSLGEIEPSDPKESYEWRSMGIGLELRSPNHMEVSVGLLGLYGSKDVPGTEVALQRGEWVELSGRGRMQWTNPPRGTFRPEEEKWVLHYPLRSPQDFTVMAVARRAEGYYFNAETMQEGRVCHSAEQSSAGNSVHLKIIPKVSR